jgi:hypothetical protein
MINENGIKPTQNVNVNLLFGMEDQYIQFQFQSCDAVWVLISHISANSGGLLVPYYFAVILIGLA